MSATHKSIISYADTTIGAVFFNIASSTHSIVREQIVPAAMRRKESPEAKKQYAMLLAWYIENYFRSLRTHEWCHILQALIYPGLYLRCIRELNLVQNILTTYRLNREPGMPLRGWLPADWQETLLAPTRLYRLIIDDSGRLQMSAGSAEDRRMNDLAENDLLEEDASIFQYKVEIGGPGSGKGYRQWLREQRRYTMTFNFLTRILDLENAYLALPPLVHASFSTNAVLDAFAQLVAFTVQTDRDLPSREGTEGYTTFLNNALEFSTLNSDIPDPSQPATSDTPSLLDEPAMHQLIGSSRTHPLQALAHDLWIARKESEQLREYMLHPYRAFDRRSGNASETLQAYFPPIMAIRLHDPALSLWDSLYIVSPRFAGKPFLASEMTYDQYFQELMGRRYLAFALVTDLYDDFPHNCHHVECNYYTTNLCRRWFLIPKEYPACDFPTMMEIATHHHLDVVGNILRPRNLKGDNDVRS